MQLSGIISISGKQGLSKIVSQTRTGLIVESLDDEKRSAVHGAERVSSLEDISIYTHEEDMLLTDIFEKMYKEAKGEEVLSHKSSNDELKNYLKSVLPNYDEDRVYTSDIKKLIQWYNILLNKGILKEEIEKAKEEEKAKKGDKSKEASDKGKKPLATTKTKKPKIQTPKGGAKKPSTKGAAKSAAPKSAGRGK